MSIIQGNLFQLAKNITVLSITVPEVIFKKLPPSHTKSKLQEKQADRENNVKFISSSIHNYKLV